MKRTTWALVTAVATSIATTGCGGGTTVVSLPPPEVSVSQPVQRELSDYFDTTGRVAAVESVEIRARVAGYLMKVGFEDGQLVKAGDVLFEIDARPYEAAVMQAEGELGRWRASLTKAEADTGRTQRLLSKGASSEKDFEAAVADRDRSKAEIQASEAKLTQAKLDLDFTKVTAPVDGRVSKTNLTVGNLVSPGTAGSAPLTTLVSVSPVYVYFDVDERTILRAQAERRNAGSAAAQHIRELAIPVEIGLATETGHPHKGTLTFIDNRVDASTGTIKARASFDNTDGALTPGLFVRVHVPLGDARPLLLVTERAVGTDQGNKYLLVVTDKNVVEYRAVKLGSVVEGGLRIVSDGIKAGEWVITNGIQRARPGMTVKPQQMDMVPPATA
jgi:RND family efflux transporter MFP subunit